MTTINTTAGTSAVQNVDWQPTNGLDAQGILLYCSSRLSSLDDLIKSRFAEQEKRNQAVKDAGSLMSLLNRATYGIKDGKDAQDNDKNYDASMGADLAKAYNTTQDPQVREKIWGAYKAWTGRDLEGDGHGGAALWQCDPHQLKDKLDVNNIHGFNGQDYQSTFVANVKEIQDGLTKDSELSMIQLQSIVSQRQQAVQMTTQLMATMNDSMKQVLGNIR
jgi:hypothetical protein